MQPMHPRNETNVKPQTQQTVMQPIHLSVPHNEPNKVRSQFTPVIETPTIRHGNRTEAFQLCIANALAIGSPKMTENVISYLTSPRCMESYATAFTHPSCGTEDCYEYFEFIGDSVVNKCVMHFLSRKYNGMTSKRSIKILARIKVNYVSKKWLAHFSEKLFFTTFISMDDKLTVTQSVLEDVFEAFIGVTERLVDDKYGWNAGYFVCQVLIDRILTGFNISVDYDKLFDAKTRLKELFDVIKIKQPLYVFDEYIKTNEQKVSFFSVNCIMSLHGRQILIGQGAGNQKKEAEEDASSKALMYLADVFKTSRVLIFNGTDYDITISNGITEPRMVMTFEKWMFMNKHLFTVHDRK